MHLCLAVSLLILESIVRTILYPFYRPDKATPQVKAYNKRSLTPNEMGARELIESEGFVCEEHIVRTVDGYVLTLQRIRAAEAGQGGQGRAPHHPVLFMHGLMMNSEVWLLNGLDSLPMRMALAGRDVWLGNSRGNKYGCVHDKLSPSEPAFWDYCLDDMAQKDLPASIDHILRVTGSPRLSYVGFSNGTAQLFACLASCPGVCEKIGTFVALSPALAIRWTANKLANAIINAHLSFVFLLFGEREMLPSALTWQRMLGERRWASFIDGCLQFLFAWDCSELQNERKHLYYAHLYSYSSTKSVVHWFQMIRDSRFQMYDPLHHRSLSHAPRLIPGYDVAKISPKVRIAVFAGERDSIIDAERLRAALPRHATLEFIPRYEHLDPLWAKNANDLYDKVLSVLAEEKKE